MPFGDLRLMRPYYSRKGRNLDRLMESLLHSHVAATQVYLFNRYFISLLRTMHWRYGTPSVNRFRYASACLRTINVSRVGFLRLVSAYEDFLERIGAAPCLIQTMWLAVDLSSSFLTPFELSSGAIHCSNLLRHSISH